MPAIRWYYRNKERAKETYSKWQKNNRATKNRIQRARITRLRVEFIAAYGPKCNCPGCDCVVPEFMTLDHIHGNGGGHRRKVGTGAGKMYTWLKRNGWPKDEFRMLCMNCNFANAYFGGCPHLRNK